MGDHMYWACLEMVWLLTGNNYGGGVDSVWSWKTLGGHSRVWAIISACNTAINRESIELVYIIRHAWLYSDGFSIFVSAHAEGQDTVLDVLVHEAF